MVLTGKEKSTFGTKLPIDIHMLNEIIIREVKNFRNYKIYRPNFGSVPLSGKFYAAHDTLKETAEQALKIENYAKKVAQARAKGPRSKYPTPATSSHAYGWYDKLLVPLERNDQRFYRPKRESPETKVEIIIRASNPGSNSKSKPTGKPADKPKKK